MEVSVRVLRERESESESEFKELCKSRENFQLSFLLHCAF